MKSFSSHNHKWPVINSIISTAHYLLNQMIVQANSRTDAKKGDPKVGGHSSASASAVHILGALHLVVRKGFDFIANKPHASPADHSYHYLLDLLLDKNGKPLSSEEALQAMKGLRKFPTDDRPYVFQSYHSHYDSDHHNFLPSGTVGIPPVVLGYLALAYEYLKDQGFKAPPAHFWALIGDSEFREGSLFEAIPDFAEREISSLTWIIDYNRQSLDGHRATHPSMKTDAHRIEKTFLANGWKVIQLRHGEKRLGLFKNPEGGLFQNFLENEISDWDLQILLQIKNSKDHRRFILQKQPRLKNFLKNISDKVLTEVLHDLGGHDIKKVVQALEESKTFKAPCAVIAHTIKGWGLEMASLGGNHSSIPSKKELEALRKNIGLKKKLTDADFPKFLESSEESAFLKKRHTQLMAEINEQKEFKLRNQKNGKRESQKFPQELGISLKMISYPHTQWMFGQWMSKMSRIASSSEDQLSAEEKPFLQAARMFVSLSPDVGTSTNLSFSMDDKIYQPKKTYQQREENWGVGDKKSPELQPDTLKHHRFLRFEIAEAAAVSCLAAFGKIKNILGINIFPVMSVYDFFIKRALDQYFYALYWNSHFILAGTPSGVTLSPEGAQHGWKSDFQIPGGICWEPFFCKEVDWILTDALFRFVFEDSKDRSGVLVRAVTRGADQKQFLKLLKTQKKFKSRGQTELPLCAKDFPLPGAVDESKLESISEKEIEEDVRGQVLNGAYHLINFEGYQDYSVGENVINIFAMGALGSEAIQASKKLLERGIYANVLIVTSPDLLLGIEAHKNGYSYLKTGLGLEKKAPILSVHDGEAGLLDNIGSILGRRQTALAVRKHSLCGRPSDIYSYHGLDPKHIEQQALDLLNETS